MKGNLKCLDHLPVSFSQRRILRSLIQLNDVGLCLLYPFDSVSVCAVVLCGDVLKTFRPLFRRIRRLNTQDQLPDKVALFNRFISSPLTWNVRYVARAIWKIRSGLECSNNRRRNAFGTDLWNVFRRESYGAVVSLARFYVVHVQSCSRACARVCLLARVRQFARPIYL